MHNTSKTVIIAAIGAALALHMPSAFAQTAQGIKVLTPLIAMGAAAAFL